MKSYLYILFFFGALNSFAYSTNYADSMQNQANAIGGRAGLHFMLDNFYNVFNKSYEDGVEWAGFIKNISIKNKFKQEEGRADLALGTIHYLHGDYENSISHYQLARDIFEDLDDLQYLGRTYNEMSVYSRKQGLYEQGLEYVDKAFNYCTECKDFTCVETSFNNRGVIYEFQEKYDLAKQSYKKAEQIAQENKNEVGLSYIYNNLAELARLQENFDSMALYLNKSLEIRKRLGDKQGVAINYANLGEMYVLTDEDELANENLTKSLIMAREIQYTDLQSYVLSVLFELNKKQGNLDQAIEYFEQSNELKDSLLDSEKIKSLSEMEVRYETQKVRTDYLEEQQARTESDLKVSNRNLWIIGVSSFAIISLGFFLLINQQKRKKAEKEKQAAILKEKEKGMLAVFDATEEERQRISKDLHDSVGQQLSGLKMAWSRLSNEKDIKPEQRKVLSELSNILDEAAEEVRDISHQMMPKVLIEFGLIPAIREMLDKSLSLSELKYEFEDFNIAERFSERVEVSLYRISQELVNNVIKHSKATYLSVQLFKNQGSLILIVEDNGKGMEENKNDGHGMLNIKSRLNTINGQVNYEAGHDKGTIATVRINLNN